MEIERTGIALESTWNSTLAQINFSSREILVGTVLTDHGIINFISPQIEHQPVKGSGEQYAPPVSQISIIIIIIIDNNNNNNNNNSVIIIVANCSIIWNSE